MNEETFPNPIQIPLATAQEWEKRYEDDNTVDAIKIKAFLIPRESLEKVLELKTEAVYAYLGINDQNEKTLLFVGAEKDLKTGKYVNVYGPPASEANAEDGDVVYDGVRPSPPY
ncbi:hypothetical protein [Flavobacterium sp. JAS]|uniref:hypothetical protein n=1 Tax=Flavobacterium sp. JAS TaxID=2897329 RepID=UPI001E5098CA|nr:hypothetical protein [Flavobacterium sp. JAS]MCD0472190.1 hypothetical protein [Flavobacterium sp. JAS]